MHRAIQNLRHVLALVVVGTLAAAFLVTAQPAAAAGPFSCRGDFGNARWACEITFSAVVVGTQDVVAYTCTAVATDVVAVQTGVSCYLAPLGSTTPLGGENTNPLFLPGPASTSPNAKFKPQGSYWVCMQASTTFLGGTGPIASQTNCSTGPV